MRFRLTRDRIAFTLIEIMLVVIIIGTIAAIMVPRLAGKQEKAKMARTKMEIASISTALDTYELDVGNFPSSAEGLAALMERPASIGPEVEWDGPYLKELQFDPWGHEYQYQHPGEIAVDYDIWSYGPDGQDGGDDDLRNVNEDLTRARR